MQNLSGGTLFKCYPGPFSSVSYRYLYSGSLRGIPITFRFWKNGSQIAEIKVDENFAKANGYESVEDMAEKTIGQAKFNEMFGGCAGMD